MLTDQLPRWLTFIIGWVVGGLALAFIIVAVRPQLVTRVQSVPAAPIALPAQPHDGDDRSLGLVDRRRAHDRGDRGAHDRRTDDESPDCAANNSSQGDRSADHRARHPDDVVGVPSAGTRMRPTGQRVCIVRA